MEDHYTTLGVDRNASVDEIKRAYRKLAHQHHPDKGGGDEEKFKQVNEAYQVLGNANKRSQYDQFGQTFESAGASPGGSPFDAGGFNINMEDLGGVGSIFEQFFGGRSSRSKTANQGNDIAVDTAISFEESARGVTQDIAHRIYQTCSHCHGNTAEPGTPINNCSKCQGRGTVTTARQTVLGTFQQTAKCPDCQGQGKKPATPCKQCRGEGRELKDRILEVNIPPGINDGQSILLSGKGEVPSHGGQAGDLYVTVHVNKHKSLDRSNDDVVSTIEISYLDAALGTKITTPTLNGEQEVAIPAGTQPNTKIRLDNLGFPSIKTGGKGDHIITVSVLIPRKLSRSQRKLLNQLKDKTRRKTIF